MFNRKITKGFKATNKNMECRGFKYTIGKVYKIEGDLEICKNGFHFCKNLKDVGSYYDLTDNVRIFEVEASGQILDMDDKSCTSKIKFVRELSKEEIYSKYNIGNDNKGVYNIGNDNKGVYNEGNNNIGNDNIGNNNIGDNNIGYYNKGNDNIGSNNEGYCNKGHYNIGNDNKGNNNIGNNNIGNDNKGNYNKGNDNKGNDNIGSNNEGYCNIGNDNKGYYNKGDNNEGNNNIGNNNIGYYNKGNDNIYSVFNTKLTPKQYDTILPTISLLSGHFQILNALLDNDSLSETIKKKLERNYNKLLPKLEE